MHTEYSRNSKKEKKKKMFLKIIYINQQVNRRVNLLVHK